MVKNNVHITYVETEFSLIGLSYQNTKQYTTTRVLICYFTAQSWFPSCIDIFCLYWKIYFLTKSLLFSSSVTDKKYYVVPKLREVLKSSWLNQEATQTKKNVWSYFGEVGLAGNFSNKHGFLKHVSKEGKFIKQVLNRIQLLTFAETVAITEVNWSSSISLSELNFCSLLSNNCCWI